MGGWWGEENPLKLGLLSQGSNKVNYKLNHLGCMEKTFYRVLCYTFLTNY